MLSVEVTYNFSSEEIQAKYRKQQQVDKVGDQRIARPTAEAPHVSKATPTAEPSKPAVRSTDMFEGLPPPTSNSEAVAPAASIVSAPNPVTPIMPAAPAPASAPAPAADEFDMFDTEHYNEQPEPAVTGAHLSDKVKTLRAAALAHTTSDHAHLQDNWDDSEGYYRMRSGEMLGGRFKTVGASGKGVFSSVLLCEDTKAAVAENGTGGGGTGGAGVTDAVPTVAVKIVRNNDTLRRAGEKERELLQALQKADPTGRYHVVRMLDSFEHRNHLCLVFEALHLNLKEVLDKFGRGVGLTITSVRAFAKQLLLALKLLGKREIVHADIKPQNILLNERYTTLKV